jgi:hypothetical protein
MRQVIAASALIDVTGLARRLAGATPIFTDPSRAMSDRYGFQTLYEIPIDLQKQLRRALIGEHLSKLRANKDAVFDHSVFGWLADWMRWLWSETSVAEWDAVLAEAGAAVELSESIHHVINGPLALNDGYRWLDPGNARQTESLLRHLYREFSCENRVTECSV